MHGVTCILHPTDFSRDANEAFRVACDLAHVYGARVVILHVHHAPVGIAGPVPIGVLAANNESQEAQQLQELTPTDPNLWIERRMASGDPGDVILAVARECGCELIVMGSHGRTGMHRLLVGSVAEHVARNAKCSVVTVRATCTEPRPEPPAPATPSGESEPG